MRDALIAARAAVTRMHEQLRASAKELELERKLLADAQRRGRLAAGIGDQETVAVAERFAAKHTERVGVLERKLQAQREEVTLAEREVADMTEQLKIAERDRAAREASGRAQATKAGLEGAASAEDELLKVRMDRAAREAAAEKQLQALKKKMGK
jgi:hypothetical protein